MSTYMQPHGILGMKWGVMNGPPYPLGASDHSSSEKKAGWRRSLDKAPKREWKRSKDQKEDQTQSKHTGLTDQQKKAIKIGAAAVAAGLAVAGGVYLYKTGALDKLIPAGKIAVDSSLDKISSIDRDGAGSVERLRSKLDNPSILPLSETPKSVADAFGNMDDSNPLKKGIAVKNNCTNVFLAFIGRTRGLNVTPGFQKDDSGKFIGATADNVLKCFKNTVDKLGNPVLKTVGSDRFNSYEKASKILSNKYPDGSIGYLDGRFRVRGRDFKHAVTWQLENGKLNVGDGINGLSAGKLFDKIIPGTEVNFFRADDLDLNLDEFYKRVIKH